MGETVRVLGIKIDKVTMEEAFSRCLGFLADGGSHLVVTPNAEILHRAGQDEELAAILNGADLTVPDGAGVVLASRWLGDPLPEKVAGVELAERLMEALGRRGRAVYLLGTRPEVVAEAARRLPARFAGLRIAGFHHGFFTETEEPAVLRQIRDGGPDLLLAALGSPRQEKWLARHLPELQVPVCIGVGGGIDLWAGRTARAPRWMISANLEWLYRIVRFGRYSRSLPPIIRFLLAVRRERRRAR